MITPIWMFYHKGYYHSIDPIFHLCYFSNIVCLFFEGRLCPQPKVSLFSAICLPPSSLSCWCIDTCKHTCVSTTRFSFLENRLCSSYTYFYPQWLPYYAAHSNHFLKCLFSMWMKIGETSQPQRWISYPNTLQPPFLPPSY